MTGPATDADGIPLNDGDTIAMLYDKIAENERLHARVIELEAEIALMRGTLSRHDPTDDDQPAVIHYDVEPNAPR